LASFAFIVRDANRVHISDVRPAISPFRVVHNSATSQPRCLRFYATAREGIPAVNFVFAPNEAAASSHASNTYATQAEKRYELHDIVS
jgi:hypothetical protein